MVTVAARAACALVVAALMSGCSTNDLVTFVGEPASDAGTHDAGDASPAPAADASSGPDGDASSPGLDAGADVAELLDVGADSLMASGPDASDGGRPLADAQAPALFCLAQYADWSTPEGLNFKVQCQGGDGGGAVAWWPLVANPDGGALLPNPDVDPCPLSSGCCIFGDGHGGTGGDCGYTTIPCVQDAGATCSGLQPYPGSAPGSYFTCGELSSGSSPAAQWVCEIAL
jgi:hypothetical protein